MDARTIDVLAALNPASTLSYKGPLGPMIKDRRWSPLHDAARDRFLSRYIRPNFGYYIAVQFASRGMNFPLALLGRDMWVYRAYLMRRDCWKNFDRHILEAFHLAHYVKNAPHLAQVLKACLLSIKDNATPEQHLREVHLKTGVPYQTLEAFEALFYNVIDRRADALYLAHEVYPDTRIVELDENYMKTSSHADLIKRVAYNHKDMDLTAYVAGLGDHTYLRKLAAREDRESELTRYLMGNGLILAHSSLLNQRAIGMSRVSNLLAASRQGGRDLEEPTMGGIVPAYSSAFKKALSANQDIVMQQYRKDAGVVDV